MFTIEHAPRAIASAAAAAEVIDSSRQTGVRIRRASSACAEHLLLGERLLEEDEVERVELGEVGRIGQAVRAVRVHLQGEVVAEALAHGGDRLDVPTGGDLQLDAQVALVEMTFDDLEELVDGPGDPDGDAAVDAVADSTEMVGQ
jgi:hypothetical protein